MSQFLPEGFEELKTPQSYWRMKEMFEGENRLRILLRPICGWIDWEDNRPYRFKPEDKPVKSFDSKKPIRPFWTLYVWDYRRGGLFILEITQNSILKTLTSLGHSKDWGDFREYDIQIHKSGSGKDTKYQVLPCPKKPIEENIRKALKESPVNLQILFEGGDPWNEFPKEGAAAQPEFAETAKEKEKEEENEVISFEDAQELDNLIGNNGTYRDSVISFLQSNFNVRRLDQMPMKIYPSILDRATKLAQKEASLPF